MLRRKVFHTARLVSLNKYSKNHFSSPTGEAAIRKVGAEQPQYQSLKQIIEYSSSDESIEAFGQFIWKELPKRIAHRVIELQSLPYNLSNTTPIIDLRNRYVSSFHNFRSLACPTSKETEAIFIEAMKNHFNKLRPAVGLVANGLKDCLAQNPLQAQLIESCPFLNGFLNSFHGNRIGTRLLTGQYIALKSQMDTGLRQKHPTICGMIDFECDPVKILQRAVDDSTRMCESNYGRCPDVNIRSDGDIAFAYIPADLHYIFVEVVKNGMRAVCEHGLETNSGDLPPMECVVVASRESNTVTVKISDQGGGISRDNMQKIFFYSFSTVTEEARPTISISESSDDSAKDGKQPMQGFGYGLPLSRLYARYFQGDLEVISMDGYGTDNFVYLNWLNPENITPLQIT